MIRIEEYVALAPFTTFDIGGPARFFIRAAGVEDLREALDFARDRGMEHLILGGGSNLLVSDAGFDGVVVRLEFREVARDGERIEAGAGTELIEVVRQASDWGLSGVESLAGIPGMLGGAVRGNAGAYGGSIGEVVSRVRALDTRSMEAVTLARDECGFSYRDSRFKRDPSLVVLSAELVLTPERAAQVRERALAVVAKREARGLACERSVGSYFMNPVVEDADLVARFEADQKVVSREGRIPAGWLIDRAGLRNRRVGAAMVSALHANYLVNTGGARAEEVLALARLVKERVRALTGVRLQEEVSRLGFSAPELA